MENILLISDDNEYANRLAEKLIFLRKDDSIQVSSLQNALNQVVISRCEIVLVHEADIEFLEELRKNENITIILISDSQKLITEAYDLGIDDFISPKAKGYEFVLRIVNNIKHNSKRVAEFRNLRLLEQSEIIDELTGIYRYAYSRQVIENFIDDNLLVDGTFIVISPSQKDKPKFNIEKMASAVKSSLRVTDITTSGRGVNIYILLPKTDAVGAVAILDRIKENLNGEFEICAGIADIADKSFPKFEREALKALSEALSTEQEIIFVKEKEKTLDEWLVDEDVTDKNYKIFRQLFNKKLEKVITPVFYRLQKAYEEKLFNTVIEQYTDSEQCVFRLKSDKRESVLTILYPGFAKIVINIVHSGLDTPENREIKLALTKVTQKELADITEDFIKEFKSSL